MNCLYVAPLSCKSKCCVLTCTMRLFSLICLLFAVHTAKATIDLQGLTDTVQTLKDNAKANFQEFVDTIDFDKVKKLDVLDILPKVQHKVEFAKKLHEQKKQFGQIVWDYKKQKFGDKLNSLQKLAQLKQQALQNLVEKKKTLAQNLFEQKQKLAQNLFDQKQKIVHALVDEKQKFVDDLVAQKQEKFNKFSGPPPKKIIYAEHPLSYHFEHQPVHHAPIHLEHPPIHHVDHHHHIDEHSPIHHVDHLSHHFNHHPHKIFRIVKPIPIKKVIIRTKIYD